MRKGLSIIFMLITFLIKLVFYPSSVYADTNFQREAVDEFVTSYMERNGLPGASIF